ncbi:uncharacterized protein JCM15063_001627 [Sporobolomyces koalae]|uniref:uncharacterized protein n=1 Tax=Sporobolomyces koalae TaxID=500713 RepID=UPI00317F76B0
MPKPLEFRIPRPDRVPFYDPRVKGGSQINRNSYGSGEPLNIIISAQSSPDVLRKNGLIAFSRSLGLWNECANLHLGDPQESNLGDGNGWKAESFVMRESRWPFVGSCLESAIGGNHFRVYKQNGTEANSGAWFLSASKEVDWRGNHKIAPNGYNLGRDLIVQTALKGTKYLGRSWDTEVEYIEGLLTPGSEGINHGIEQDGRVALLTVREH